MELGTVSARKIRCREIVTTDVDAIADLLTRGFPGRPLTYWLDGLRRQAARTVQSGYPQYGYLLEAAGAVVGVLLLMYSEKAASRGPALTCNVASWYVEPQFRNQASLLSAIALKHAHVTYVNVTPAPATWKILEAQGYKRYCNGLFFAVPSLSRGGGVVSSIADASARPDDISQSEFDLLRRHAGYRCLSLICRTPRDTMAFVLAPFRARQGRISLPAMQLIYCRSIDDFVACAGAVGRFLLARGKPVVIVDANGPIPGLVGIFSEARGQKYFRGPNPPRLGNLADTEFALYGI
jgi:hypothetical protein